MGDIPGVLATALDLRVLTLVVVGQAWVPEAMSFLALAEALPLFLRVVYWVDASL